jgi:Arc/MetJ family transcription regulator
MKTTVDISDALFEAAKRRAAELNTTLRSLIEEGLRRVLEEPEAREPFELRDESVGGDGLDPDVREGGWRRVAELVYEGQGG